MKKLTLIALVFALVPVVAVAAPDAPDNKDVKTKEQVTLEATQAALKAAQEENGYVKAVAAVSVLEKAANDAEVAHTKTLGYHKQAWKSVKAQGSDLKSVVTGHKVSTGIIMALTVALVKGAEYLYNTYAVEAKDASQIASDAKLAAELQRAENKAAKKN
jgi:hypothetical protein